MGLVRIAYIIQAHKNPEQLNTLITKLSGDGIDFYVHIDKKSNIITDVVKKENVYLVEDRVDVKWGHISQVQATLKLMQTVQNTGKIYDYVWLISGQDYPIKSNEYIQNYLSVDKSINYMDVLSKDNKEFKRYLKRNETWYPTWGASPIFIMRVVRKLYNYGTGGPRNSIIKRKNYLGDDFNFGSSWFTITYEAMNYILKQVEEKPYIKYFKNCICPDESFFQTILTNSKFKNSIKRNLVYVDWSEGKKNPKVLGIEDIEKLSKSDKLVARKFDGIVDKSIDLLSK